MDKQNLLEWTEYAVSWFSHIPVRALVSAISLIGLIIGALLIFKTSLMIELQRVLYAQMNWKIEPISLPKELRTLRAMGLCTVIFLTVILFLIFFSDLFSA